MTDETKDALQQKMIQAGWKTPRPEQSPLEPTFKAKWLKALRSGEYKSVQGSLRGMLLDERGHETEDFGFCCLGVACEVVKAPYRHGDGFYISLGYHDVMPPDGFQGLAHSTMLILAEANDGEAQWATGQDEFGEECAVGPRPFDEIANWIEAFL